MKLQFKEPSKGAILYLLKKESVFKQNYLIKTPESIFYSIAWNKGEDRTITIDEIDYDFKSNTILPLMTHQCFAFENTEDIVIWQFNPEFYCILNHDAEVGCVGFLFYGLSSTLFVSLDEDQSAELSQLQILFEKEFDNNEEIKETMLRMLLVSLIIRITRLAKKQYIHTEIDDTKFELLRRYNLLVELHFRQERQVQFYAGLLNKSPKTISNVFASYSKKKPIQIIHERVILEAKRLFTYTNKSVKEIANELGFEDAANFSSFFKNHTDQNPSDFKKSQPLA